MLVVPVLAWGVELRGASWVLISCLSPALAPTCYVSDWDRATTGSLVKSKHEKHKLPTSQVSAGSVCGATQRGGWLILGGERRLCGGSSAHCPSVHTALVQIHPPHDRHVHDLVPAKVMPWPLTVCFCWE